MLNHICRLHGTGSSAQNLFFTELNKTYEHIIKRGGVLRQSRVEKKIQHEKQQAKKREIYESFKQPDGTLKLSLGPEPTEIDLKQKEWFDNLPEDYKGIFVICFILFFIRGITTRRC